MMMVMIIIVMIMKVNVDDDVDGGFADDYLQYQNFDDNTC